MGTKVLMPSLLVAVLAVGTSGAAPKAISYGGGSCGNLAGGVALACSGNNFESFSSLACTLGRNYVHPLIAQTIEDAYQALARTNPTRRWQYGELGFKGGGRFWPHRTHRAGVSADFFVPVVDGDGHALLPVHPFNLLGYGVELDGEGRTGRYRIDFHALADHLAALEDAGRRLGVRVRLIILDKPLQALLRKEVPSSARFKDRFNNAKPWIRHDEHYHVEFTLPAEYRRPLQCR